MSKPDIRWQRETALRHVDRMKEELKGQDAPDQYFAERAAQYVQTTTGKVLEWMRVRP